MACVANFSKSKPEISPVGSVSYVPDDLLHSIPKDLGSRAPFLSA